MKVNGMARSAFSRPGSPFDTIVSGMNCYVGERAGAVRKKSHCVDYVNYVYGEKSKFIYAKRNADGIRR